MQISKQQIGDSFPIVFAEKQGLKFHEIVFLRARFAWNMKPYFQGKICEKHLKKVLQPYLMR